MQSAYRKRIPIAAAALLLAAALPLLAMRADAAPDPSTTNSELPVVEIALPAETGTELALPTLAEETPPSRDEQDIGEGEASYYGLRFAGRPTASGEPFDPGELTAAHRTLPMGSRVRVTNVANGAEVVVRINDRGPFHGGRVIDLSRAAAQQIGLLERGTGRVRLALLL